MEAQAPYHVHMDAEHAMKLVKAGGTLLLLAVPPSTSFGIDRQMFIVGPNFKGVKMMPPGPHFIYYCAASRHGGDVSPITGFFVHVGPSQVIVRLWDPQQERMVKLPDSSEYLKFSRGSYYQEERYAQGVSNMEFDRHLAPYDLPHYALWQHLSNYITPTVIDRLQPVGGDISVMAEAALAETGPQTPAEKRMYEHIAKLRQRFQDDATSGNKENAVQEDKPSSSGRCFYTRLPGLIKRAGMSASELTALNLDKSQELESVLTNLYGGAEDLLLGELQFVFIAFLMGQSLEAFGQRKAIVSLLFSCVNAPLQTRTNLFTKFLEVLYWQLKQGLKADSRMPEGPTMDDTWFSDDIFLRHHFKNFFALVRDAHPINGDLLYQAKRLRKLVESRLGWVLEDQTETDMDDEYAPVVVSEEDASVAEC